MPLDADPLALARQALDSARAVLQPTPSTPQLRGAPAASMAIDCNARTRRARAAGRPALTDNDAVVARWDGGRLTFDAVISRPPRPSLDHAATECAGGLQSVNHSIRGSVDAWSCATSNGASDGPSARAASAAQTANRPSARRRNATPDPLADQANAAPIKVSHTHCRPDRVAADRFAPRAAGVSERQHKTNICGSRVHGLCTACKHSEDHHSIHA